MHYVRKQKTGDPGGEIRPKLRSKSLAGKCLIDDCEARVESRGMCKRHYERWRRNGHAGEAGFRQKLDHNEKRTLGLVGGRECVVAESAGPTGSSRRINERRTQLPREIWVKKFGEVPNGLQVLHWCQLGTCVNIDHLYLGTNGENRADSMAVYDLGLAVVRERLKNGGPGISRGHDSIAPPR